MIPADEYNHELEQPKRDRQRYVSRYERDWQRDQQRYAWQQDYLQHLEREDEYEADQKRINGQCNTMLQDMIASEQMTPVPNNGSVNTKAVMVYGVRNKTV